MSDYPVPTYTTTVTQSDVTLIATVTVIGRDLLITITGGDHPHIGDVLTLTKDQPIQTIRYPSHDNRVHKDDLLALPSAKALQPLLPGSCTILAGLHIDHISKVQIQAALDLSHKLAPELMTWLKHQTFATSRPHYYGPDESPA